jgi:hypothetical protein
MFSPVVIFSVWSLSSKHEEAVLRREGVLSRIIVLVLGCRSNSEELAAF